MISQNKNTGSHLNDIDHIDAPLLMLKIAVATVAVPLFIDF